MRNNVWADPIPSSEDPCKGRCTVNSSTGICPGCYRNMKEIREWSGYSNEEKIEILAEAKIRRESVEKGRPFYAQSDPDRRKK